MSTFCPTECEGKYRNIPKMHPGFRHLGSEFGLSMRYIKQDEQRKKKIEYIKHELTKTNGVSSSK